MPFFFSLKLLDKVPSILIHNLLIYEFSMSMNYMAGHCNTVLHRVDLADPRKVSLTQWDLSHWIVQPGNTPIMSVQFRFLSLMVLDRVWLFATPWTVVPQAPLSMGFSRKQYRSALPFPSPGDLPHPGIQPASPAWQADSLPLSHLGSLYIYILM